MADDVVPIDVAEELRVLQVKMGLGVVNGNAELDVLLGLILVDDLCRGFQVGLDVCIAQFITAALIGIFIERGRVAEGGIPGIAAHYQ
jgi:hypothetical protein